MVLGRLTGGSSSGPSFEEQMGEEAKRNAQSTGLGYAHGEDFGGEQADGLLDLVDPDIDSSSVPPELRNLINKELPLAFLKDEEVTEQKWIARALDLWMRSLHPPEDSPWQGVQMAYWTRDAEAGVTSITDEEQVIVKEISELVGVRATRGRGGNQQKEWHTSYAVSRVEEDKSDEKHERGFLGRFKR